MIKRLMMISLSHITMDLFLGFTSGQGCIEDDQLPRLQVPPIFDCISTWTSKGYFYNIRQLLLIPGVVFDTSTSILCCSRKARELFFFYTSSLNQSINYILPYSLLGRRRRWINSISRGIQAQSESDHRWLEIKPVLSRSFYNDKNVVIT